MDDYERPYPCPCCGAKEQMSSPVLSFDICQVCGWEDDGEPDSPRNVNRMTISEARQRWQNGETLYERHPNPCRKTKELGLNVSGSNASTIEESTD